MTNQIDETQQVANSTEMRVDQSRLLRKELEGLRKHRQALRVSRCAELNSLESRYRSAKANLHRKTSERYNSSTYRQFLLQHGQEPSQQIEEIGGITPVTAGSRSLPSSNYIVQRETPLLSAMHRSFCVLPHQMEVLEKAYECEVYSFFRKEMQGLHVGKLQVSHDWMKRLSDKVECNNELYQSYQNKLQILETEIKDCRYQLAKQREFKDHLCKENENEIDFDEETILSGTENSSDSELEISPQQDTGVGFLKDALQMFTASPPFSAKGDRVKSSPIGIVKDSIHESLCKGGAAFQLAASKFRLPFGPNDSGDNSD